MLHASHVACRDLELSAAPRHEPSLDNPRTVQPWRFFLVVLMAVLLPVKGAVAAAMLCPGGARGAAVGSAPVAGALHEHRRVDERAPAHKHAPAGEHARDHATMHGDVGGTRHLGHGPAHGPAAHAHGLASSPAYTAALDATPHGKATSAAEGNEAPAASSGSCPHCASCCSAPPLPVTTPTVQRPPEVAAVHHTRWAAPEPTFLSSGPERPPRRS